MAYGFEDFVELNLRKVLRAELARRQKRNPRYSMRAFARDLATSHSALSEIMAGKRKISPRLLRRLLERMKISSADQGKLLTQQETGTPFEQLSITEIREQSRWYHSAILELALTRNFRSDPSWIARRLGLRTEVARRALKRLVELGHLRRLRSGRLVPAKQNTTTIGQVAARKILVEKQIQFTERHLDALKNLPVETCSMVGLTVAMNPEFLPEVRKRIYTFIREVSKALDSGTPVATEVYRLNLGFFPVTRPETAPVPSNKGR